MKRTVSEWIEEYMYDCKCRQLRPKTMHSYEQTLRLFERWLREAQGIEEVKQVTEPVMRRYIIDLQERGKYTAYAIEAAKISNYPERRRDFREKVSNITINNYMLLGTANLYSRMMYLCAPSMIHFRIAPPQFSTKYAP